jgi:hypothetical protein
MKKTSTIKYKGNYDFFLGPMKPFAVLSTSTPISFDITYCEYIKRLRYT